MRIGSYGRWSGPCKEITNREKRKLRCLGSSLFFVRNNRTLDWAKGQLPILLSFPDQNDLDYDTFLNKFTFKHWNTNRDEEPITGFIAQRCSSFFCRKLRMEYLITTPKWLTDQTLNCWGINIQKVRNNGFSKRSSQMCKLLLRHIWLIGSIKWGTVRKSELYGPI